MAALDKIPQSSVSIAFLEAGCGLDFRDGYVHRKSAPCTIIAQPTEGRYEVNSLGENVVAGRDEAFLASTGQPLEIIHHAPRRGGVMRAHWIHVEFLLFTTVDFVSLLKLPPKLIPRFGRPFGETIVELLKLQRSRGQSLTALAQRNELGFRALRILCEAAPLSEFGEAFLLNAERLAPVLTYVRDHYAEPITIDDLAGAARLSRSRFHSYFRRHMRISPMDYVKTVRVREAQQLLLTTDQPIYEIAEATGFLNPYHFSREFKASAGIPPKVYRKQNSGWVV
jgi:AraC-like DNA-binding protein